MKYTLITVIVILFSLIWGTSCTDTQEKGFYNRGINIIPQPNQVEVKSGIAFQVNRETGLIIQPDSSGLRRIVSFLNDKITAALGYGLKVDNQRGENCLILKIEPEMDLHPEGYTLDVTKDLITIAAKSERGIFYGIQSFLQLLPAEILSAKMVKEIDWIIHGVSIKDHPQYGWRGMHLDVCRHFYPVEFIKKYIDMMTMYKMNTFHWHLTEDQGWRIEIKKYPALTQVGSQRIQGDGKTYGGFYTQEEIKEVVRYAAERFIDVVPEIEMPGHALAALAAYPQYSCSGGPFRVRNIWGIEANVYCAGKEKTFKFLEDIISEVVELFPFQYFHIGGDECLKDQWKICPDCQARIKQEGLKDEHELQSYFIRRIEKFLMAKNKKLIGWDEILEGGLAPEATVMSWRGEKGAVESAKQGHNAVMSPTSHCYLDYYQGDRYAEPLNIGGYLPMEKVYSLVVTPKELNKDQQQHILGAQGNVWTEYMPSADFVEYMAFPRMIALAEVVWTAKENCSWDSFQRRLNNHHVRLDHLQVNYHIPLPEGPFKRMVFTDKIKIPFNTSRSNLKMVYTIDGSEPESHSKVYRRPLRFRKNSQIKIRTILPSGQLSKIRSIAVVKQKPLEPMNIQDVSPGLTYRLAKGYFLNVSQLQMVKDWQTGILPQLHFDFSREEPCALIAEGFIEVRTDDIYTFSANISQLFVGDHLLIDTQGKSKRVSLPGMIALKAGKHKVKVIFLNNIEKGVDSSWYNLDITIQTSKDTKPAKVGKEDLFHKQI